MCYLTHSFCVSWISFSCILIAIFIICLFFLNAFSNHQPGLIFFPFLSFSLCKMDSLGCFIDKDNDVLETDPKLGYPQYFKLEHYLEINAIWDLQCYHMVSANIHYKDIYILPYFLCMIYFRRKSYKNNDNHISFLFVSGCHINLIRKNASLT